MKVLIRFIILPFCLCFYLTVNGQDECGGTFKADGTFWVNEGRKVTFKVQRKKPRGMSIEEWRTCREKLPDVQVTINKTFEEYENRAHNNSVLFAEYLNQLQEIEEDSAVAEALCRSSQDFFGNVYIEGPVFKKGKVDYIAMSFCEYIEAMKGMLNDNQLCMSVCWSHPDDIEKPSFDLSSSSTRRIKGQSGKFYDRFIGKGYFKETVSFFNGVTTIRKESCKEIQFYLRYVSDQEDESAYRWDIFANKIVNISKDSCKGLPDIEGCNPVRCDSACLYQPLNPLAYLVPGLGWHHFKENKFSWTGAVKTVLVGSSIYYSIDQRIKYKKYERMMNEDAITLAAIDDYHEIANRHYENYIIFGVLGPGSWLIDDIFISIKNGSQKKQNMNFFQNCDITSSIEEKDILKSKQGYNLQFKPNFSTLSDGTNTAGVGLYLNF